MILIHIYMTQDVCLWFFKGMNSVVIFFFGTKWNDKSLACIMLHYLNVWIALNSYFQAKCAKRLAACRYLINFHSLITCSDCMFNRIYIGVIIKMINYSQKQNVSFKIHVSFLAFNNSHTHRIYDKLSLEDHAKYCLMFKYLINC